MKNNNILITVDGLESLKKELHELKDVKLPAIMSRVSKAREDGDLSENSAYQFGKQEEEFVGGRIDQLEEILAKATVVRPNGKKSTAVDIGCNVTVTVNGKRQTFIIVGDWEAKPAEMKISGNSPLGKALIGKKVGEKAEVDAPAGKIAYTILEIS